MWGGGGGGGGGGGCKEIDHKLAVLERVGLWKAARLSTTARLNEQFPIGDNLSMFLPQKLNTECLQG